VTGGPVRFVVLVLVLVLDSCSHPAHAHPQQVGHRTGTAERGARIENKDESKIEDEDEDDWQRGSSRNWGYGMSRYLVVVFAVLAVLGTGGCSLLPKPKESASKKLLGFEDSQGRLREESVEDMEKQQAEARNGLQLTLRTTKDVYGPHDSIILEAQLRNVTGGRADKKPYDIPVYFEVFAVTPEGARAPWLLKPELRSEATGSVVYRVADFKVPEKDRANYYHYVVLPPGAYVGHTFTFPGDWLRPGRTFSFVCAYEVPEDYPYVIVNRQLTPEQVEQLGLKLAYVRVWTGRLFSNRVYFRIERKRFLGLF
jgi:hypothetical protein